ncbi:hypothetical protein I4U23_021525 [Adineta vaga]|nr:hypothetical protein I4U23_021525 [Adineta vaga]
MQYYLLIISIYLIISLVHARWELVFSDDFNCNGEIDRSKWTFDEGVGENGWGNHEEQFYTTNRKNVRCEYFPGSSQGRLIIEAHRERHGESRYTSARIRTKKAWTYGRWQIRAKVPEGRGLWSAIWMLPQHETYGTRKWPDSGEINIMEQVGFDPTRIHASVHTKAHNHRDSNHPSNSVTVPDVTTRFRIYTLDWEPHRLRMFVSDNEANPEKKEILLWNKQGNWKMWPFDRPFNLIINLAIGGDWGGQKGLDVSAFPGKLEVDWVKYFQRS